jgi:hypothetical protein
MSTHSFEMIAQHEISERRWGRVYLLGLLGIVSVVIAGLFTAL